MVLALIAPLMNLSDPIAVRYYWRQWDGALLRLLLPSSVLGVVAVVWLLSTLPQVWLARTIGAVALLFAVTQLALSLRGPAPPGAPPPWPVGVGAGFVMGVASMVAHSGGVVLNLYLLALRLPTPTILATGNALIVFTDAVKLLGYWRVGFLTGSIMLAAVLVIPLLAVGAWLGVRVGRRLPRRAFESASCSASRRRLSAHGVRSRPWSTIGVGRTLTWRNTSTSAGRPRSASFPAPLTRAPCCVTSSSRSTAGAASPAR